MADEQPKFDHWAIVEMLGHRQLAGRVTEQTIAGVGFLRVDVPRKDGAEVTKLISPKSVYALTPCTEEVARACAVELLGVEPVKPASWQRQLPASQQDDDQDDGYDPEPYEDE
jgi:hypothetical protein